MVANEVVKRNISGMQVIKTLQVLLEDNYTMQELIHKLNDNEKEPIFNHSVVSKYINTCRYCGINIPKIHNKYFVSKMPFGLSLLLNDYDLLQKLQTIANQKLNGKSEKMFNSFIRKLNQYSNKDIIRVEKNTKNIAIEMFDRAIQQKRKVLLMFKVKALLECVPVDIVEQKGKTCFKVLHNDKERLVALDRISGLEVLGKIVSVDDVVGQEVIFNIKGPLIDRYTLRDHETEVARKAPEYVRISNIGEDKKELFTRLLRYDNCCEIVSPQSYRDEFKALLNNMLANYGE